MDLSQKKCVPCGRGTFPLSDQRENELRRHTPQWILLRDGTHKLRRQFTFRTFKDAMLFVNEVAGITQEERHHPDISVFYHKVQLDLFTHAAGGLSENDFIMASKIDALKH